NKLAAEDIPVTFALSLHAPDDELRDEMIPVNTRWKADEAIDAAYNYFQVTGRRVSIEYALIKDMNDHAWRAELLAQKLNARGRGWVHVNPIPLNPTPGSVWTASEPEVADEFVRRLIDHGIPTTIRDTRGSDIDGACGQLAAADGGTTRSGHPITRTGTQFRRRRSNTVETAHAPAAGGDVADTTSPRMSGWKNGYDPKQVDSFFKRARESFERPPPQPGDLDSRAVRTVGFDLVRKGYHVAVVDAALDRLEDAFAKQARDRLIAQSG